MILKLKRTPGIYLVGFMGAGKTTVGRLLADRLGWNFVDLDQEIEAETQQPIAEIFDQRGEAEFRRLEREALRRRVQAIECGRPTVMAVGGGAFAQPDNCALLQDNGVTIWLDASLELVRERVSRAAHRPLARDPQAFARLFETRRNAYARADVRIPVAADDPDPVVQRILELEIFR